MRSGWFVPVLSALLLVACGVAPTGVNPDPDDERDPAQPIVRPTTKILSASARSRLHSFDRQTGVMRFSAGDSEVAAINVGHLVVGEPTSAAPDGLMRRVTGKRHEGDHVILETVQATLEEAIVQGAADLEGQLTPENAMTPIALRPGVKARTGGVNPQGLGFSLSLEGVPLADGVTAHGTIAFNTGYKLGVGIKCAFALELPPVDCSTRFHALLYISEQVAIGFKTSGKAGLNTSTTLAEYPFAPIVLYLGVPVVFIPRLIVSLDANGQLNTSMNVKVSQNLGIETGFRKKYGKAPQTVFDVTKGTNLDFGDVKSDENVQIDVTATAKVRGEFKLYGLAGPGAEVIGGVHFKGQSPSNPPWTYTCTLRVNVFVELDAFFWSYEKNWNVYNATVCAGTAKSNAAPVIKVVIPTSGTKPKLNQSVPFGLNVYDLEPGCCAVVFTSDKDGKLGVFQSKPGSASAIHTAFVHTFTTPGPRQIMVIATDASGATDTHVFGLDVVNTPPTVTILQPTTNQAVYRNVPFNVVGLASDETEPSGSINCVSMKWQAQLVSGGAASAPTLPENNCAAPTQVVLKVNGPWNIQLTATDSYGMKTTKTVVVIVSDPPNNVPPQIAINKPAPGVFNWSLTKLSLEAYVLDPDNGSVTYQWLVKRNGSSLQVIASGTVTSGVQAGTTIVTPYTCLTNETELTLSVSDGTNTTTVMRPGNLCVKPPS
jgi:hypothetical protein